MSGQERIETPPNRTLAIVIAVYLIAIFCWRAFTPANEYPMRTSQVLTMLLDAGMIAGLVGLKSRLANVPALFWAALFAGIGLFAIRMTGDAAWWTGHLMYRLR